MINILEKEFEKEFEKISGMLIKENYTFFIYKIKAFLQFHEKFYNLL